MPSNPKDPQRLKHIDFDNIFEDQKQEPKDEIPQTLFESFRNTESSTVQNADSGMLRIVLKRNPGNLSQPGSSPNLDCGFPTFSSTNRHSIQPKRDTFDDFGFGDPAPQPKPPQMDFLDLKVNQPQTQDRSQTETRVQAQAQTQAPEADLDLDLMGLRVDDGIIDQDIQNMEQNLFKKEMSAPEAFVSNTGQNLEPPGEGSHIQSMQKVRTD